MAYTITSDHLKAIAGVSTKLMPELTDWINKTCPSYGIDNEREYAHFLAQACHESGGFKTLVENLNYSADGLLVTFPRYFNKVQATAYARQPNRIAAHVYANRLGNGDENSGEGWKFRGRGIFQTTGRSNYLILGISRGKRDLFINNPEFLEQPEYAVWSACEYWKGRGLTDTANHPDTDILKYKLKDKVIDVSPIEYISRSINGGINGLPERKKYYATAKKILV